MNLLFVHQNAPAQFRHVMAALAAEGTHKIVCVSTRPGLRLPGVGCINYPAPPPSDGPIALRPMAAAFAHGQSVAAICEGLQRNGFTPDLVIGHPGWGETLFIKDVFPQTALLHYCEFFYQAVGADIGFDPAQPVDLALRQAVRMRNAPSLLALAAGDHGIAPTEWQRSLHPAAFLSGISVAHDGIDTDRITPDPAARFTLPDRRSLAPGAPIVTYVARGLEPQRGFPSFMRAVPAIQRARPDADILVVGGDAPRYGPSPPGGGTWRDRMLDEIRDQPGFNPAQLHFLGILPFDRYVAMLQVSAVHVYLTVPFVLSWSMLEAMAAGCLVVGSATPPVAEVITDGVNGLLVPFFAPDAIAARALEGLAAGPALAGIRRGARQTVLDHYRLVDCVARQRAIMDMCLDA